MSRNRFTDRETVRLELSDGDWIEVKTALNYGESKRIVGAGLHLDLVGDAEPSLNLESYNIERILVWVTKWSFQNSAGAPERITAESIGRLDPATGAEIEAALDAHIKRLDEAKNVIPPG